MKTADLIAKLPENIVNHVRELGKRYNSSRNYTTSQLIYRSALRQYTYGLKDARLITSREAAQLFVYGTCIYEDN